MPPKRGRPTKKVAEEAPAEDVEMKEEKVEEVVEESEDDSEDEESEGEGEVAEEDKKEMSVDEATADKIKKKIGQAKNNRRKTSEDRGVVYLGNLPYGFFEDQLKKFFGQFGTVTRIYLSRSKKTHASRGWAFVEFEHPEVAQVVAETMNNYLMHNRLVKCQFKPFNTLHPDTFKNANKKFQRIDWRSFERKRHNKERTEEQKKKLQTKLVQKDSKKRQKLQEMGIDYEFPGYAGAAEKAKEEEAKAKQAASKKGTATKGKKGAKSTPAEAPAQPEPKAKATPAKKAAAQKEVPAPAEKAPAAAPAPAPAPAKETGKKGAKAAPTPKAQAKKAPEPAVSKTEEKAKAPAKKEEAAAVPKTAPAKRGVKMAGADKSNTAGAKKESTKTEAKGAVKRPPPKVTPARAAKKAKN